MTVFTEGRHPAEFMIAEGDAQFSREVIVVASGSGVFAPGTVLGKITASGKYAPAPAAEVEGIEGAETGAALPLYGGDATDADVSVTAIVRDAVVNKNCLEYEASVNTAPEIAAKLADLKAAGIVAR